VRRTMIRRALVTMAALAPLPAAAKTCEAQSTSAPPAVVELFTSEGCSSCPPADEWLSGIAPGPDVVALAFHVNYWNHLGWQDRFATPATTARQYTIKAVSGAAYVYTPQVVLNGKDFRNWRGQAPGRLPRLTASNAPTLHLRRETDQVHAEVGGSTGTGDTGDAGEVAGYWAVLADGQRSRIAAGENAGRTLRHDHVVSSYQPVDAWPAREGRRLSLRLPASTVGQRVAFVVTDRRLSRPLQAVVLSCD
jgi:hypothetical protein